MRFVSLTVNVILCAMLLIVLTAALGSLFLNQPVLLSVMRSYSMYPLFERGDIVLVERIRPKDLLQAGDIVIFRTESGSLASQGWVIHRIVGGNAQEGYITKGDNNAHTDQESLASVPVKREWMVSRVIPAGGKPVIIPLLGYLPLWAEGLQKGPLAYAAVIAAVAVIGVAEGFGFTKRRGKFRRKKRTLEVQAIYLFSGLTVSVLVCAMMLSSGQYITLRYAVSDTGSGAMTGSPIGMLRVGDEVEQPLAALNNQGFLPIVASVVGKDPGLRFSHSLLTLKPGDAVNVSFRLTGLEAGSYSSAIRVALFYPLLPKTWIHRLHQTSYALALATVSVIPGLPLMLYPLLHPRLRRQTAKRFRQAAGRLPGMR